MLLADGSTRQSYSLFVFVVKPSVSQQLPTGEFQSHMLQKQRTNESQDLQFRTRILHSTSLCQHQVEGVSHFRRLLNSHGNPCFLPLPRNWGQDA